MESSGRFLVSRMTELALAASHTEVLVYFGYFKIYWFYSCDFKIHVFVCEDLVYMQIMMCCARLPSSVHCQWRRPVRVTYCTSCRHVTLPAAMIYLKLMLLICCSQLISPLYCTASTYLDNQRDNTSLLYLLLRCVFVSVRLSVCVVCVCVYLCMGGGLYLCYYV